jgi:polyribonucleotide nucleotidyltransferase
MPSAHRRMSGTYPLQMKSAQETPVVSEPRVFDEVVDQNFFRRVVLEIDINGNTLRLETGEIGRLAAGAVTAKQGDSIVYATACADLAADKEETVEDFVPLSVHYQERSSAAGKTSGGYIKRDSRPSDEEVLVARIIDRTVRPIFPPGFSREVVLAFSHTHTSCKPFSTLSFFFNACSITYFVQFMETQISHLMTAIRLNIHILTSASSNFTLNANLDLV